MAIAQRKVPLRRRRSSDKQEQADQPVALTAGPAGEASPAGAPDKPAASGVEIVEESAPKPEEARRLFSQKATSNPIATTAMGNVPRGARRPALRHRNCASSWKTRMPPYYPEILPSYRLGEGTVIEVRKAAFRVGGQWYDLSYRCEVDANATKVVGFAFSVGAPLPPSEWRRRGLPLGIEHPQDRAYAFRSMISSLRSRSESSR